MFWSNGRNFYSLETGPIASQVGGISANGCGCFCAFMNAKELLLTMIIDTKQSSKVLLHL